MGLIPAKYRSRPFSWAKDPKYLAAIRADAQRKSKVCGIFFDTSGNARSEVINSTAQYQYLWRSDQ